jgi:hypothetical protein
MPTYEDPNNLSNSPAKGSPSLPKGSPSSQIPPPLPPPLPQKLSAIIESTQTINMIKFTMADKLKTKEINDLELYVNFLKQQFNNQFKNLNLENLNLENLIFLKSTTDNTPYSKELKEKLKELIKNHMELFRKTYYSDEELLKVIIKNYFDKIIIFLSDTLRRFKNANEKDNLRRELLEILENSQLRWDLYIPANQTNTRKISLLKILSPSLKISSPRPSSGPYSKLNKNPKSPRNPSRIANNTTQKKPNKKSLGKKILGLFKPSSSQKKALNKANKELTSHRFLKESENKNKRYIYNTKKRTFNNARQAYNSYKLTKTY